MIDRVRWAETLAMSLADLTRDYKVLRSLAEGRIAGDEAAQVDPVEAQNAATAAAADAVIKIVTALNELPELQSSFCDGPLPDLISALGDLGLGKSPSLLTPTKGITGRLSVKMEMQKLRACYSVAVLQRAGLDSTNARAEVARIFSEAGHRGKKGGRVSPQTLYDWGLICNPNENGDTHQRLLAKALSRAPATISREEALRLVKAEAAKRQ